MNILIDRDRCEGHGQCLTAAPDVLDLDDEGVAVVKTSQPLADDLASQAESAVSVCPVAALAVDTDTA